MTNQSTHTDIARIEIADTPYLQDFYRRQFPEKQKLNNAALWSWEYVQNPIARNQIPFFVIRSTDAIHGAIGAIRINLQIGENTLPAHHPVDFFVDPAYKGLPALRLFRKMLGESTIHIASYVSDDAAKLFDAAGFINLSDNLKTYRYTLNTHTARAFALTYAKSLMVEKIRLLIRKGYSFISDIITNDNFNTQITSHLSEELVPTQVMQYLPKRVGIVKNFEYLNWRYNKSPSLTCKFFTQLKNGTPNCVITVHEIESENSAAILDIVRKTDSIDEICRALINVIDYYAARKFRDLTTTLISEQVQIALKRLGFRQQESNHRFMYYAKDQRMKDALNDPGKWDFNLGDTDVY